MLAETGDGLSKRVTKEGIKLASTSCRFGTASAQTCRGHMPILVRPAAFVRLRYSH